MANKLEAGSQASGEDFRARETVVASAQPRSSSISETTRVDTASQARARAFATQTAAEAMKEHPELAGAYAAVAAVTKKLDIDGVTTDQRVVVMQRVQQNIMKALEAGARTRVNVRESKEIARHNSAEREIG